MHPDILALVEFDTGSSRVGHDESRHFVRQLRLDEMIDDRKLLSKGLVRVVK